MSAHILQSVKLQFPQVYNGSFQVSINVSRRRCKSACGYKNLQITAEMMGARPRKQLRKVVANMKNQMLESISGSASGAAGGSDADGSGDADVPAGICDTPSGPCACARERERVRAGARTCQRPSETCCSRSSASQPAAVAAEAELLPRWQP